MRGWIVAPRACQITESPHRLLAIHSVGYGTFNPQRPYYLASHALLSQCKTLPCDRDSAWHLEADEVHVQGGGRSRRNSRPLIATLRERLDWAILQHPIDEQVDVLVVEAEQVFDLRALGDW